MFDPEKNNTVHFAKRSAESLHQFMNTTLDSSLHNNVNLLIGVAVFETCY